MKSLRLNYLFSVYLLAATLPPHADAFSGLPFVTSSLTTYCDTYAGSSYAGSASAEEVLRRRMMFPRELKFRHTDTRLFFSNRKQQPPPPAPEKEDFSRELYLREEAESPFRKVRLFVYAALGGGAITNALISATRIAAALSGINTDLLSESAVNLGVDVVGIVVLALLFQNDRQAQESRLKRASQGAALAKLMVRALPMTLTLTLTSSLDTNDNSVNTDASTPLVVTEDTYRNIPLASLRRGRGIEKRVVIAAAGPERINQLLKETAALDDQLALNDLLIVPVVLPQCDAPEMILKSSSTLSWSQYCVALPVGPAQWRKVLAEELREAAAQGVNVEEEGFCVILKKNGRIGQRTRGIYLDRMVGEVTQRREMGMDVKNI